MGESSSWEDKDGSWGLVRPLRVESSGGGGWAVAKVGSGVEGHGR